MDRRMQMEQFSIAFVTAVAAQAGCNHATPVVDDDSVDLSLFAKKQGLLWDDPMVHLQLKATCEQVSFEGSVIKYNLRNLKNYEDLRSRNLQTQRILVVVYMPEHCKDWIEYQDDCIHLYRHAFWVSLRGMPETSNKSGVTIEIPTSQRFNAAALSEMMTKIANGVVV